MSPTRRQFLYAAGATGATVYLAQLTLTPGEAALVSEPAVGAVVVDRHGLPPSTRLFDLSCSECGHLIGEVLMDELQAADDVVCDRCHRDQIADAEAAADDDGDELDDMEKEELRDEVDELREQVEKLSSAQKVLLTALDRAQWELRDIESALRHVEANKLAFQVERVRELVDPRGVMTLVR